MSGTSKPRQIRIVGQIAYVPLTRGFEATIDASDVPLVEGRCWHALPRGRSVYAARSDFIDGRVVMVLMHRLIMAPPAGTDVDHADTDGLNNRRGNMRCCTRQENQRNKRTSTNNSLGVKGTFPRGRRFGACIEQDGRSIHLGLYDTLPEARAAYRAATKIMFGRFARLA